MGITLGDINGVGPEVAIKALKNETVVNYFTPVIFGNAKVLAYYKKALKQHDFNWHMCATPAEAEEGKVNVVNCWEDEVKISAGEDNATGGTYALKSLVAATEAVKAGEVDVLVTAPINKNNIQGEGFNFAGHTEFLQAAAGSSDVLMFMVSEVLRVAVVTGHVPLREVSEYITKDAILSKLRILNRTLKTDFWIEKPRIAVLGLNPHASDNGLLGNEEELIIAPAIQEAFDNGMICFGPYAADGFFGSGAYRQFDAVLAMYHDQGLVPFKALSFGNGVNFTAGLTIVRTSPDHGTGYDIAGKGRASEQSFMNALFAGVEIYRNRTEQAALLRNQLRHGGRVVTQAGDIQDDES